MLGSGGFADDVSFPVGLGGFLADDVSVLVGHSGHGHRVSALVRGGLGGHDLGDLLILFLGNYFRGFARGLDGLDRGLRGLDRGLGVGRRLVDG